MSAEDRFRITPIGADGYVLMTGATGLLGTYLMRDLLLRGVRLAVVVRSRRILSALDRVEGILQLWERQTGQLLPRPVVFDGDITRPGLGLTADERRWIARHCRVVLHNAASLTFYARPDEEEPYRSNVNGTRHVLDMCHECGIDQLHHVSTAYVAGQRQGRILESELDCDLPPGNDYEASKIESERMARQSGLPSVTVYRPGIIIGDSKTGFTSTFHGFYVPLKLLSVFLDKLSAYATSRDEMVEHVRASGERLTSLLALEGHESKYLVPVDWTAGAMAELFCNPDHHGGTYHLTPRKPVLVSDIQGVLEDSFLENAKVGTAVGGDVSPLWQQFEKFFVDGMATYRAYFKPDPEFDSSATQSALPQLPCPTVDRDMLHTMCRFALDNRFQDPFRPVPRSSRVLTPDAIGVTPAPACRVGIEVTGPGGGDWSVLHDDRGRRSLQEGIATDCRSLVRCAAADLKSLLAGEASVQETLASGRLQIVGEAVDPASLQQMLIGNGALEGETGPAEPSTVLHETIVQEVVTRTGCPAELVTPDAEFLADLGMEPADVADLMTSIAAAHRPGKLDEAAVVSVRTVADAAAVLSVGGQAG
ncbi:SDR family oxidoreductase [Maioricimonas sp. JC845]|uniref:SDR family oxidoreductase n=1 Tax=Maioricimonas sp. JC845 TaxID=3232138 RepID=UPI00345AC99D